MSKADEMFKELGYENGTGNFLGNKEKYIWYRKYNVYNHIYFYETKKEIYYSGDMTLQELQAINEKCKELGWL